MGTLSAVMQCRVGMECVTSSIEGLDHVVSYLA